jgi:uncharacterized membrane protein YfcA
MFSLPVAAFLAVAVVGTSFLSGIFGMAGGMILMGLLVLVIPVAPAMVLQGVAQLASNGSRAWLWRRSIRWRGVGFFLAGAVLPLVAFTLLAFTANQATVLIVLGATPMAAMLLPADFKPNAERRWHGMLCGTVCTSLQLLAGVSGPILDVFFTGTRIDRKELVATKAAIQTCGHLIKIVYFGRFMTFGEGGIPPLALAAAVVLAVAGTHLSRRLLEAISDVQFRAWTQRLILATGTVYTCQGVWLLLHG